ncbi:DNA gyrase subunit B [Mycoplasmoides fastidiosum]|uniref:DNA topoisomerase (ATP-hydrolyzing) n=1 Tax=Mycoplasmoides fastidiosum TaxID=92758 RepID=A0ABU0LYM1_9BACT|nr:DNA gyrase subunit B [Mycoplasmoides fastidiosum]MDQ0513806.1 DNA gyrase subunit B [Mycoplasmoides fastidiosum]UUD37776.1 DNA gyrase subunit B [Mycoplasmoides fastidiosum]
MTDRKKLELEENKTNYNDDSIDVLEGLEPVRMRPGMYIGSTDVVGLHQMVWEIIDNSVDEAVGGFANEITVTLKPDRFVSVEDNGRGIPVGIKKEFNISTLEVVLTKLHAGGKFNNDSYKVSGGTHGVGASCVTALSTWLEANVYRDGNHYQAVFVDGGNTQQPTKIINQNIGLKTGTKISWRADYSIIEDNEYNPEWIKEKLKRLAYLNKGVKFNFIDENNEENKSWLYEKGIVDWVKELNQSRNPVEKLIISGEKEGQILNRKEEKVNIKVNIAFQYVNMIDEPIIYCFSNNIFNDNGGTHDDGFKNGLLKVLRKFMLEEKLIKERADLVKADVFIPLTAIVALYYATPMYQGQTKNRLISPEVSKFVQDVTEEVFERFLNENPADKKVILNRVKEQRESRLRYENFKSVERKNLLNSFASLPGKLADCATKDPEISELYIVEGDSAGGSAKNGREREFQAILPLRGKVLNTERMNVIQTLSNSEIQSLLAAIGCSFKEQFDISKLRYNKIIIMTDADIDGSHIRILLLTFFYRYMRKLIEDGHVYIAQPPLYRVSYVKKNIYLTDDAALEEYKLNNPNANFEVSRFKGLGEMSPEQLWETTMDPSTRTLLRVNVEDAMIADQTFLTLMGNNGEARKEFILKNAKAIKNLDI